MTRHELTSALLAWLESERARFLAQATKSGVPPSVVVSVAVPTIVTETTIQYEHRERHMSPLGGNAVISAPLLFALAQETVATPSVLHDYYGLRCAMWTGMVFEERAQDTARQTAALLLRQVRDQYLAELVSLDAPDDARAGEAVEGLLELIERDAVDFVTTLPVAGIRVKDERLDFRGVTVRPLTSEELGSLAEPYHERRFIARPVSWSFPRANLERCVLIVREPWRKDVQPRGYRPHAVAIALQLLGFELRGRGRAGTYTEPGPPLSHVSPWIPLADRGAIRDFTLDDLRLAVDLADLVPERVFTGPQDRKAISLHRFSSAACEMHPGDALVDFVTALEALLLGDQGECWRR